MEIESGKTFPISRQLAIESINQLEEDRFVRDYHPKLFKNLHQFVKENGRLVLDLKNKILASLYTQKGSVIKDFGEVNERIEFKLQPGKYTLIYIDKDTPQSERTVKKVIEIFEGKTVLIN